MSGSIILFLPSFEGGGVERNAVYFANAMIERGIDVYLLYCRKRDEWFSKLDPRVKQIKVAVRLPIPFLHERLVDAISMLVFGIYPILQLRWRGHAAIISFQSNVIAIILALICRMPVAVRISNHFLVAVHERSLVRKLSERAKALTYRYADKVIANSQELAADYGLILKREVATIPNPVDFDLIRRLKEAEVEEELFTKKRRPIIVSAGRLVSQKNFSLLLRAMAIVVREISCDLVILGDGNEKSRLYQLARELGIEEVVHFLGFKGNIYSYFSRSDLFVLSSNYEGMPNVLIEAVACGLPVVSTRCKTGPAEVLCEGRGGELVPIMDEDALAAAIIKSFSEPAATRAKHLIASQALEAYRLGRIQDKYAALIEAILPR